MKGGPLTDRWSGSVTFEKNECLATSFALLVSLQGPLAGPVSKLKHGRGDDWNQHRSDVGNLTRYMESRWKRDLIWQVIDLPSATVDDLLPVAGACTTAGPRTRCPRTPRPSEDLADKLRDYLDRGGFLLAEGYCGGAAFDAGFRKLIEKVFPEPEYRLQKLDPEHPIWRAEELIPPESMQNLPPLLGIEFGCRTSVVYAPDPPDEKRHPLSCLWELSRPGATTKYPASVQKQIDAGLSLGINILAYATNRELQGKEVQLRPGQGEAARRRVGPGHALRRQPPSPRRVQRRPAGTGQSPSGGRGEPQASRQRRAPGGGHHRPGIVRLSHGLHARAEPLYADRGGAQATADLSPAGRHDLRQRHLREQGVRRLVPPRDAVDFPRAAAQTRSRKNDPLLTTVFGGFDLSTVTRRDPQSGGAKQPLRALSRKVPPELEGIKIGEHYGGDLLAVRPELAPWKNRTPWSARATPARTPPGSD